MLSILLPKGSLEEGMFQLFERADIPIKQVNKRSYHVEIDDSRFGEAIILRPQEIPTYVAKGEFDLGITGRDWIKEQGAEVEEVADLQFSKKGWRTVKIVLATAENKAVDTPEDMEEGATVVTEYPRLTRRFLESIGKRNMYVEESCGATEVKVPRLADYLVDITETGETLRQNGKKILATLLESSTKLIANKRSFGDPAKREDILSVASLLQSVIDAQGRRLIKMNVPDSEVDTILSCLPALCSPTMVPLSKEGWVMIETVVDRSELNLLLPELKERGARDILKLDISKMVF